MIVEKKKCLHILFVAIVVIFALAFNCNINTAKITSLIIFLINILAVIKSRKNWNWLIISSFILWFNYSFFSVNLWFPVENLFTGWKDNTLVMVTSINILLIFNALMLALLPQCTEQNIFWESENKNNRIITMGGMLLLVFIFIYGYARPESLGVRAQASSIYEYSIVIFIISFYYANSKLDKFILTLIMIAYIAQDMIFGGRATALLLIIMWFLIFLSNRVKVVQMIPVVVIGLLLFSAIGSLRENLVTSFDVSILRNIANSLKNNKFVLDTSYSAMYTSGTFILMEEKLDMMDRLSMFGKYLLSIIFGSKVADSNLSYYTRQYYVHYYGGCLPFYGHFYLGYIGVVFFATYTMTLLRRVLDPFKEGISGYRKCLGVYLTATVIRWYLYSPAPLLRGTLIFSLVYMICWGFDKYISARKE